MGVRQQPTGGNPEVWSARTPGLRFAGITFDLARMGAQKQIGGLLGIGLISYS